MNEEFMTISPGERQVYESMKGELEVDVLVYGELPPRYGHLLHKSIVWIIELLEINPSKSGNLRQLKVDVKDFLVTKRGSSEVNFQKIMELVRSF